MLHIQRQLWRGKRWGKGQKESSCLSVCRKKEPPEAYIFTFFFFSHSIKHFQSHSVSESKGAILRTQYSRHLVAQIRHFFPQPIAKQTSCRCRGGVTRWRTRHYGGVSGMAPEKCNRRDRGTPPPPGSRDISSGFEAQRPLATQACTTSIVVNVAEKEGNTILPGIIKPRRLRRLHADSGLSSAKAPRHTTRFQWSCYHILTVARTHHAFSSFPIFSGHGLTGRHATPILQKKKLLIKAITLPPSLQSPFNSQHPSGYNETHHPPGKNSSCKTGREAKEVHGGSL